MRHLDLCVFYFEAQSPEQVILKPVLVVCRPRHLSGFDNRNAPVAPMRADAADFAGGLVTGVVQQEFKYRAVGHSDSAVALFALFLRLFHLCASFLELPWDFF